MFFSNVKTGSKREHGAKHTDLGLSLGDKVDSRGPQREEARPPNLPAVFFQVQRALQVRDDQRGTLKALLIEGGHSDCDAQNEEAGAATTV